MTDEIWGAQTIEARDDFPSGMPAGSVSSVFDWFHQHPAPSQLPLDADGNLTVPSRVGTPEEDGSYWERQTTNYTCAVEAQRCILEEYMGRENAPSEAQLLYDSWINGWFTETGTKLDDMGKLLQKYNVLCHTQSQASVEDLWRELSQGHKVIVAVHGGDLWHSQDAFNQFIQHYPDHAIWVTGLDFTDAQHPKVIINDSGDPEGKGKAYDLEIFKAAWLHGGLEYCATDNPPPHVADLYAAFDPSVGYFPDLAQYFDTNFPGFENTLHTVIASGRRAATGDHFSQLSTTPLENLTDQEQNAIFRMI